MKKLHNLFYFALFLAVKKRMDEDDNRPPTSEEVLNSPYLSALAADYAGGDPEEWTKLVIAHRKKLKERGKKHYVTRSRTPA